MVRVNYAIVFVSNMQKSVAFYRDVIGLSLKFESPDWSEFSTDGATLALHATDEPRSESDNSHLERAGRCHPGLRVPNLDVFHKRMITERVACIQEPSETFGARVAQYLDPDGLVISVGEERSGS